jgi:ketosteroid isomerase-like protein
MKMIPIFAAALALASPAAARKATPQSIADEVAAADRAFSAAGANANIADSIASMMAPDAVMPAPNRDFAVGKEAIVAAIKANPANAAATAKWAPVRVGVSADGTQAFSYGFMTIHDAGKPDRRAKYLSYWVKRPEGWRVALFKRAGSPEGEVSNALRSPALPPRLSAAKPKRLAANVAALKATEKAFSDRAQKVGLGPAFVEFGSADAMNMGGSADFTFGNDKIGADIGAGSGGATGSPLYWAADRGALVASSGDLGVTWGFIRQHGAKDGELGIPFFTVWRKASPVAPWRYVAE